MLITADTHVHWYPSYDHARFLTVASKHLAILAGDPPGLQMLFLTERSDCRQFQSLMNGSFTLPEGWKGEANDEPVSCLLVSHDGGPIQVVSGRQTVAREGIEVLSLGVLDAPPDGTPAREIIAECKAAGGFPVLPWSPGKWMGRRGKLVMDLVLDPSLNLAVGDPSHRPRGWRTPAPFHIARALRRLILPGSDPLPAPEEEFSVGRYGIRFEAEVDPTRPWHSLRARFLYGDAVIKTVGRRDGLSRSLRRQLALRKARKAPAA